MVVQRTHKGGTVKLARRRLAAFAAVALLCPLGLAEGIATASGIKWTLMKTPADDNVTLLAVSCPGADYCLAVGDGAAQYNGNRWTDIASPAPMAGLACISAKNCIAVGQSPTEAAAAWSWNGRTWASLKAYNPVSSDNGLNAVRCPSATSCTAVGWRGNGHTSYPLAERWNGKSWSGQPISGAPSGMLTAIACASVSKCEAVGNGFNHKQYTLALGYDGTGWRNQPMPSTSHTLAAISCFSTGCVAVGANGDSQDPNTLAETWNGSKWSTQGIGTGDPSGEAAAWTGVHCASASSCVAVGYATQFGAYDNTLADTWNGRTWTENVTPNPGPRNESVNQLFGLACAATICTAVGSQYAGGANSGSLAMRN
jgi:hypothetical protein